MKEETELTDRGLRELLQKHLLEAGEGPMEERLLADEKKLAFDTAPVLLPPVQQEKKFLERLQTPRSPEFPNKWLLGAMLIAAALLCFYLESSRQQSRNDPPVKKDTAAADTAASAIIDHPVLQQDKPEAGDTAMVLLNKAPEGHVQLVQKIRKENADCGYPVTVTDSVLFSPHSPDGSGAELEIKGHAPDDPMFFEQEHNTVWYRYVAPAAGQLTFDIIPLSQEDDYDFMFYKYDGGNLRSKILNQQILPLRACISRNDKALKSMTGLKADPLLPSYVHSGNGPSYVRYVDVNKNDIFYLLVDNVYPQGNGHTIRFHLHVPEPGELSVGQRIVFDKIAFLDSDIRFAATANEALDSLYRFMVRYPDIKIEIDGFTNMGAYTVKTDGAYPDAMTLSRKRAEAIAKYLVRRGIDGNRLVTKGYGFSKMIVPNPKTIRERKMNVRAEIVILSLNYRH